MTPNLVTLTISVALLLAPSPSVAQSDLNGTWELADPADRNAAYSPLGKSAVIVHGPERLTWSGINSRDYDLRTAVGAFQRGDATYTYTVRSVESALLVEERWTRAGIGREAAQIFVLSLNHENQLEFVVVTPILNPLGRMLTARVVYRRIE